MRVLIVCNYDGSIPYIPILINKLAAKNIQFDILDIGLSKFHSQKDIHNFTITNIVHPFFLKIPLIRKYLRRLCTKSFLKKLNIQYSVVNFHYASTRLIELFPEIKNISNYFVLNMWGSDFYRDRFKNGVEKSQLFIYNFVDKIAFANEYFLDIFCNHYKMEFRIDLSKKSYIVRWGIEIVDLMQKISSIESKEKMCGVLGIPTNRIIVTVGYNASSYQQHEKIIESIAKLEKQVLKRLFIVVPMTYRGEKADYAIRVEGLLKLKELDHIVYLKELSDQNIARLRLISDITINMQITDDLSASIQEHLFSGNIVICGEWLPYGVFLDQGIRIDLIKIEDLESRLIYILQNLNKYQEDFNGNRDLVYQFSSWSNNIFSWVNLYKR